MRRSTAAAVGTLTGAALIVGVRLSVSAPVVPNAAPPVVDLANSGQDADPEPGASSTKKPSGKKPSPKPTDTDEGSNEDASGEAGGSGLKKGIFKGSAVKNPYGTIQVSIGSPAARSPQRTRHTRSPTTARGSTPRRSPR